MEAASVFLLYLQSSLTSLSHGIQMRFSFWNRRKELSEYATQLKNKDARLLKGVYYEFLPAEAPKKGRALTEEENRGLGKDWQWVSVRVFAVIDTVAIGAGGKSDIRIADTVEVDLPAEEKDVPIPSFYNKTDLDREVISRCSKLAEALPQYCIIPWDCDLIDAKQGRDFEDEIFGSEMFVEGMEEPEEFEEDFGFDLGEEDFGDDDAY